MTHFLKQVVFIDHMHHLTTFIDPRLPYVGNDLSHSQDSGPAVVCVVGSEKGPSAYYKIFQDGASKLTHGIKIVRVIRNSGHRNSKMDRLISSAKERICRGHRCLL